MTKEANAWTIIVCHAYTFFLQSSPLNSQTSQKLWLHHATCQQNDCTSSNCLVPLCCCLAFLTKWWLLRIRSLLPNSCPSSLSDLQYSKVVSIDAVSIAQFFNEGEVASPMPNLPFSSWHGTGYGAVVYCHSKFERNRYTGIQFQASIKDLFCIMNINCVNYIYNDPQQTSRLNCTIQLTRHGSIINFMQTGWEICRKENCWSFCFLIHVSLTLNGSSVYIMHMKFAEHWSVNVWIQANTTHFPVCMKSSI